MSGGMILAEDFAEKLRSDATEISYLTYEAEAAGPRPSVIPAIFEVRPVSEMSHGEYHLEAGIVDDTKLKERRPGQGLNVGTLGERRKIVHLKRYFERSYVMPQELVKYGVLGADRARAGMESFMAEHARLFSRGRYLAEQEHAASLFNSGGLTAGHAVFDNSHETIADPGGVLVFDGKPLFNTSGNTRTALSGTTYYTMAGANSLTATNLETAMELGEATNAYDEMGNLIDNTFDTLVVPTTLRAEAERIVKSDRLANSANNDINPWTRLTPIVWPFLTDTDAWFVGRSRDGLIWWQGGDPDIQLIAGDRTIKVSFQAEFGAQVREWRRWIGNNVSAS